jgi:hypothetical protein
MISPLPGPSTIIHALIVFTGGTVKSVKVVYKKAKALNIKENRAKILSIIIILLVCLFISIGLYYSVAFGFSSDKSNLNIIERLFDGDSATAGISKP